MILTDRDTLASPTCGSATVEGEPFMTSDYTQGELDMRKKLCDKIRETFEIERLEMLERERTEATSDERKFDTGYLAGMGRALQVAMKVEVKR